MTDRQEPLSDSDDSWLNDREHAWFHHRELQMLRTSSWRGYSKTGKRRASKKFAQAAKWLAREAKRRNP